MPASLQKIKTDSVKPNSKTLSRNVDTCKKLINQYGMITPPVIGDFGDGTKAILHGDCVVEAAIELETDYAESIVVPLINRADGDKLSLMLMQMSSSTDAINEGTLINNIINSGLHNQTEIAGLLSRSVSWVNKRLSLVTRLEPTVREMVSQRLLSPQSAQEIARMPPEIQRDFSSKVINGKIPKATVERLASEYGRVNCPDDFKALIISDPAKAIGMIPEKPARQMEKGRAKSDPDSQPIFGEFQEVIMSLNNTMSKAAMTIYQAEPITINKNRRTLKQLFVDTHAMAKIISLRLGEDGFPQGKYPANHDSHEGCQIENDFPKESLLNDDFHGEKPVINNFPEDKPIIFKFEKR
jgi:ParB family chromosome partitioning protein